MSGRLLTRMTQGFLPAPAEGPLGVLLPSRCPDLQHWGGGSNKGKDTWRTARGPMAIARLEAHRIGWSSDGPFKLKTSSGHILFMIEVSPKMIQTLAVQSHHLKLELKAAINLGATTLVPYKIVLQPIMRIVQSKRMLPWQAGLVRAAVVGHLWTGSRQRMPATRSKGFANSAWKSSTRHATDYTSVLWPGSRGRRRSDRPSSLRQSKRGLDP
jgi:hypothetical protein